MSSFKIGRAEVANCLASVSMSGDVLDVSGGFSAATLEEAFGLRQQLLGLVGSEEQVVPVVSDLDPQLDGFYRVLNVTVDTDQATSYEEFDASAELTGWHNWSASLLRLANGFARPQFETFVVGAVRDNGYAVTTPTGILAAMPIASVTASREFDTSSLGVSSTVTLATADGNVTVPVGVLPYDPTAWSGYIEPADYYRGSAVIEVSYGGVWLPVIGQQLPLGVGGDWRISNGYCRVYPSATASVKGFTVETYRSGAWHGTEFAACQFTPPTTFGAAADTTGDSTGYSEPIILVNNLNVCVVQTSGEAGQFTFTLRAGDTWVEVRRGLYGIPGRVAFRPTSAISVTTFSGGHRATANDANGLRMLMATTANEFSGGTGALAYNSSPGTNPPVFQFTADYQAGVVTTDTGVRDLFYAARYDRRRVVIR